MFYVYYLSGDILCLGERLKKGTYRPTVTTIPCSQIMGALEREFGQRVPAAGYLKEPITVEYMTFSSSDHYLRIAKLPLTVEYLRNPMGFVFIKKMDNLSVPDKFTLKMGALKSKGFGTCLLEKVEEICDPVITEGRLKTRIYEDLLPEFGVEEVLQPVFGYLFVPKGDSSGVYVRSLFEGSIVKGYRFILEVNCLNGETEEI